jgi:NAD(P)-dependent dehydrogenase (short-subunit alcohol dehydrogenase family)
MSNSTVPRIAIVTGATAGLGREMTLALLDAGHRVAAVGRSATAMDALLAGSGTARERILPVLADVTSAAECDAIVARTVAHFGAVDGLVNNAGINLPTEVRKRHARFWDVSPEDWHAIIETNVNGPFYLARAVAPHLIARGWGRIVNHVTSYGTMVRGGDTPYGPSKAALEAATTAWAAEFDATGVTVNALLPGGAADTGMVSPEIVPDRSRLVPAAAVRAPIVWLFSPGSDGITARRLVAVRWDPNASSEENLARAGQPAGWPETLAVTVARPWNPV